MPSVSLDGRFTLIRMSVLLPYARDVHCTAMSYLFCCSSPLHCNVAFQLIAERVRAGLKEAKAKGNVSARPRVVVDGVRIGRLRAQGLSWAKIAAQLG